MDFHPVEANLRDSFRALCARRPRPDVLEIPGLSFASLGVAFQMFNAVFFNAPVESRQSLVDLMAIASLRFQQRQTHWSLWVCEGWIPPSVRRCLLHVCSDVGLRLASELPGMAAIAMERGRAQPRDLEILQVDSSSTMADFRTVGASCFRVPPCWFAEVFNDDVWTLNRFRSFVGYRQGQPVATSALVVNDGIAGIYNVAVLPEFRGRGFGEAMTRFATRQAGPVDQVILQSTTQGIGMYRKMGFQAVTRILVYASG